MVLALDYLRRTRQDRDGLALRAAEHVAAGYERLRGFEVKSDPGGFEWWGRAPANLFLTAYALAEFHDLAAVHPVDPALLARISAWLARRQQPDGSWSPEGERAAWSTDLGKGRTFDLTAYVAWALARAGAPSASATAWLEAHAGETANPYGLALASLALLAADRGSATGRALVDRLVAAAEREGPLASWAPADVTAIGARGASAAIETTALAVQALFLDGRHLALARRGVARLVAWRGADGRFGTTQSTILALRALLAADPGGVCTEAADVTVRAGPASRRVRLDAASTEPVVVELGEGDVPVSVEGADVRARVAVSRTTWVPWTVPPPTRGRLRLRVAWPKDPVAVGRDAYADVLVQNAHPSEAASVVTVEVGIPPGCDVEPEGVTGEGAASVERGERTVVIYLRDLPAGAARGFRVAFRPRYALDVRTAPSKAYEYYVPEEAVDVAPQRVRARR